MHNTVADESSEDVSRTFDMEGSDESLLGHLDFSGFRQALREPLDLSKSKKRSVQDLFDGGPDTINLAVAARVEVKDSPHTTPHNESLQRHSMKLSENGDNKRDIGAEVVSSSKSVTSVADNDSSVVSQYGLSPLDVPPTTELFDCEDNKVLLKSNISHTTDVDDSIQLHESGFETSSDRGQSLESFECLIDQLTDEIRAESSFLEAILRGDEVPLSPTAARTAETVNSCIKQLELERNQMHRNINHLQRQYAVELVEATRLNDIKVKELQMLHEEEVNRLHTEFEQALVQAQSSAVQITSIAQRELKDVQSTSAALQADLISHKEMLAQQTMLLERRSFSLTTLQKEYDQIEDELLETLDLLDDQKEQEGSPHQLHLLQQEVERLQYGLACQLSKVADHTANKRIIQLEDECKCLKKLLSETTESLLHLQKERDQSLPLVKQEIVELQTQLQDAAENHAAFRHELEAKQAKSFTHLQQERDQALSLASQFKTLAESLEAQNRKAVRDFAAERTHLQLEISKVKENLHEKDTEMYSRLAIAQETLAMSQVDLFQNIRNHINKENQEELLQSTAVERSIEPEQASGTTNESATSKGNQLTVPVELSCLPESISPIKNIETATACQGSFDNISIEATNGTTLQEARRIDDSKDDRRIALPASLSRGRAVSISSDTTEQGGEDRDRAALLQSPTSAFGRYKRPGSKKDKILESNFLSKKKVSKGKENSATDSSVRNNKSSAPAHVVKTAPKRQRFSQYARKPTRLTKPGANGSKTIKTSASRVSRLAPPKKPAGDLKEGKLGSFARTTASALAKKNSQIGSSLRSKSNASRRPVTTSTPLASVKSSVTTERKLKSRLPAFGQRRSNMPSFKTKSTRDNLEKASQRSALKPVTANKCRAQNMSTTETGGKKSSLHKATKASPKDMIKNVLVSSFPARTREAPTNPTPPRTVVPDESIDLSPSSPNEKFQSLFLDWSTAKKGAATNEEECLPASLAFTLSSAVKYAHESSFSSELSTKRPRQLLEELRAKATPHGKQICQKQISPHFTPLIVRNVIVDVFSPEELLISPSSEEESTNREKKREREAIVQLQSFARMKRERKRYVRVLRGVAATQALARGVLHRRHMQKKSKSLVTIQSVVRSWLMQNQYTTTLRAVTMLQSRVRGGLSRHLYSKFQAEKENSHNHFNAAVVIQRIVRGSIARSQHEKLVMTATILQTLLRGFLGRKMLSTKLHEARRARRRSDAATVIQKITRGWIARVGYDEVIRAAILLQSLARGVLERKRVLALLHQTKAAQIRLCAVSVVQSMLQSWIARKRYSNQRRSATTVQSVLRGYLERQKLDRAKAASKNASAMLIQAFSRSWLARKRYTKLLCSVIVVQSLSRGRLRRMHFLATLKQTRYSQKRSISAVTIQALARGVNRRSSYVRTQRTITLLQARARGKVERNRFNIKLALTQAMHTRLCSATTMQRCARGWIARTMLVNMLRAATMIQALSRGVRDRKRVTAKKNQAIETQKRINLVVKLQKLLRAKWARGWYARVLQAVTTVQRMWRRALQRKSFSVQLSEARQAAPRTHSAVLLQAHTRGRFAVLHYARVHRAVLSFQTLTRGYLVRKRFLVKLKEAEDAKVWYIATVAIQKHARAKIARVFYAKALHAVTTLQALLRGAEARNMLSIKLSETREAMRRTRAAVTVQAHVKSLFARLGYAQIKRAVRVIQATVRGHLERLRFSLEMEELRITREHEDSAVALQSYARGCIARSRALQARARIVLFQSYWRKKQCRTAFMSVRSSSILIQALARVYLAKRIALFRKKNSSAVTIQACWRRLQIQREYSNICLAVVLLQKAIRGRLVRCFVESRMEERQQNVASTPSKHKTCSPSRQLIRSYLRHVTPAKQKIIGISKTKVKSTIRNKPRMNIKAAREFIHRTHSAAAVKIQSGWRRWTYRAALLLAIKSAIRIQAAVRGRQTWLLFQQRNQTRQKIVRRAKSTKPSTRKKRKAFDNVTPKKTIGAKKRKPLSNVSVANFMFSPLKTRRGTKVSRTPVSKGENYTHENKPSNVAAAPPKRSVPLEPIAKMKVIGLREELLALGVEKSHLRKLRKAGLVQLLNEKRAG